LILPDNAPWVLHWIEWCLYAYWGSLPACFAAIVGHKAYQDAQYSFPTELFGGWYQIQLMLLAAFALWVLICVARQGYGLG